MNSLFFQRDQEPASGLMGLGRIVEGRPTERENSNRILKARNAELNIMQSSELSPHRSVTQSIIFLDHAQAVLH